MMVYLAQGSRYDSQSYMINLGIFSTVEKAKERCEQDSGAPLKWSGPKAEWRWVAAGGSHRVEGVEVDR